MLFSLVGNQNRKQRTASTRPPSLHRPGQGDWVEPRQIPRHDSALRMFFKRRLRATTTLFLTRSWVPLEFVLVAFFVLINPRGTFLSFLVLPFFSFQDQRFNVLALMHWRVLLLHHVRCSLFALYVIVKDNFVTYQLDLYTSHEIVVPVELWAICAQLSSRLVYAVNPDQLWTPCKK